MEKKISQRELLRKLLLAAIDPFSSQEKINDIEAILRTSSSFSGMNHLALVRSYLDETSFPFRITREEALNQVNLALKEGNKIGYYYLYCLSKLDIEKRKYLNLAIHYEYPPALLEYAKLLHSGQLFDKNIDLAYQYYKKASLSHLEGGYLGMIQIDIEKKDYQQEKKDYDLAKINGFTLPGIIE
ncbi:MAG: hypothetical protein WCR67_03330 [Bacilli bacterium]